MDCIPLCQKCRDAVTKTKQGHTYVVREFVGCKADVSIKSYADAQQRCPLLVDASRREDG